MKRKYPFHFVHRGARCVIDRNMMDDKVRFSAKVTIGGYCDIWLTLETWDMGSLDSHREARKAAIRWAKRIGVIWMELKAQAVLTTQSAESTEKEVGS